MTARGKTAIAAGALLAGGLLFGLIQQWGSDDDHDRPPTPRGPPSGSPDDHVAVNSDQVKDVNWSAFAAFVKQVEPTWKLSMTKSFQIAIYEKNRQIRAYAWDVAGTEVTAEITELESPILALRRFQFLSTRYSRSYEMGPAQKTAYFRIIPTFDGKSCSVVAWFGGSCAQIYGERATALRLEQLAREFSERASD